MAYYCPRIDCPRADNHGHPAEQSTTADTLNAFMNELWDGAFEYEDAVEIVKIFAHEIAASSMDPLVVKQD